MPDSPPGDGRTPGPAWPGPIWRAAPTWLGRPGGQPRRSRRWVVIGSLAAAALIGGASAALAEAGSGPPVHAPAAARTAPPASRVPATGSP